MDTENMIHNETPPTLHISEAAIAVREAAIAVQRTATIMHAMLGELRDSKIWTLIIRK